MKLVVLDEQRIVVVVTEDFKAHLSLVFAVLERSLEICLTPSRRDTYLSGTQPVATSSTDSWYCFWKHYGGIGTAFRTAGN
jgi:hypothetical protein